MICRLSPLVSKSFETLPDHDAKQLLLFSHGASAMESAGSPLSHSGPEEEEKKEEKVVETSLPTREHPKPATGTVYGRADMIPLLQKNRLHHMIKVFHDTSGLLNNLQEGGRSRSMEEAAITIFL